jgi:predicted transcriptional regulator
MYKTQLYLPDEAKLELEAIARKTSMSKSELIRRAVAEFTSKYSKAKLTKAYGIWKSREINIRSLRDEWSR